MKKLLLLWGGVIATLLFAGACTEYDDSDLKKRVDQVEEDLDNVKEDVEALKRKVDGLNSTYRALTALLNGGIVSDVQPVTSDDGTTGYKLIVTTVVDATTDPVTTQTSEYTVWNGKDGGEGPAGPGGAPGAPGEPGRMPEIGVALDEESGRYYWTLDGEPMTDAEGNRVWATGEKGEDGSEGTPGTPGTPGAPGAPGQAGAAGITPQLKIDQTQKEGQTGDAWFVSYDDGATWTELGVFGGSVETSDIQIAKSPDGKKIIITQGSNTFEFPIVSENPLAITIEIEGDGLHMGFESVAEVAYKITGASADAVVKTEFQNSTTFRAVTEQIDARTGRIVVTSPREDTRAVAIVSVYDGKYCAHASFKVFSDLPTVSFVRMEEQVPVLYGSTLAAGDLYRFPGRLVLNKALAEATKVSLVRGEGATLPEGAYAVTEIDIPAGVTEYPFDIAVARNALDETTGSYLLPLTITSDAEGIAVVDGVLNLTLTNVPQKIALTAADYSSPYGPDAFPAYGEGDSSVLCDGKSDQHWGSNYWSADLPTSEYGVYIDVALPADLFAVSFRYQNRNGNGKPTSLALAVSSDDGSSWDKVGEIASGLPSDGLAWFQTPLYNKPDNTSFGMVRFGITTSNMGDLVATPAKSASLMELEVYGLY